MKALILVGLLVALCCLIQGRKHHKYHGKKELKSLLDLDDFKFGKALRSKHMRGKHMLMKEGGHIKSLHDGWMKVPKDTECKKMKCGHKEFCLVDPQTGDEKCVGKKQFREGRRLFKELHREKMFMKNDMKSLEMDKKLTAAEHMKDVYHLLKDYKKNSHEDIDVKMMMKKTDLANITEGGSSDECRPSELYEMRNRLVSWFVLLHTESRLHHHRENRRKFHDFHKKEGHFRPSKFDEHHKKGHHKGHHKWDKQLLDSKIDNMKTETRSKRSTPVTDPRVETEPHDQCKCLKSAMWEFRKKDINMDSRLSHEELADMEQLKREPCLKPFIKSCDTDGDGSLSHGEWCCCMSNTIPPCAEKKRLSDPKEWVPRCDKEGYYEREQCDDDSGYCWCVDINGNQIPKTKKQGSAHCGRYDPNGHLIKGI